MKKTKKPSIDVTEGFDLIPSRKFDRAQYDNDPDWWAFECAGEPIIVSADKYGVIFNETPIDGDIARALMSAYAAYGAFTFLGVIEDGLGIAMVTHWKGIDMFQHVAGPRVIAAATLSISLHEDGWGERVYFLPVLKTTEEKSAATAPVYYNSKAPYGEFYRLEVVPEVHDQDGPPEDEPRPEVPEL